MPKDKTGRASTSHKNKSYAYKPYSNDGKELAPKHGETNEVNDWEDATCPICMESPHNAVLLICTSHDKGCRPYMCDTSYRHSNCLDQYRKAHAMLQKGNTHSPSLEAPDVRVVTRSDGLESNNLSRMISRGPRTLGGNMSELEPVGRILQESSDGDGLELSLGRAEIGMPDEKSSQDLVCPLCRGEVKGWTVIESARLSLNQKARACAQELCDFTGIYEELRAHARGEHPSARPSEVDPVRQRDWRRLERQRDIGDVLSSIRSAMPDATVLGDYVIEDDYEDDVSDFPGDGGHWWTVFLLFQVFGPAASVVGGRPIPSRLRGALRGSHRPRQGLWGENAQLSGSNEGSNLSSANGDTGDRPTGPARRRRSTYHMSEDNPL